MDQPSKSSSSYSTSSSTIFTTCFKSPFEWLRVAVSQRRSVMDHPTKEYTIRQVLEGDQNGVVNLWELRELALQPGGLLSADLRKRAWPKLTGGDQDVLSAADSSRERPSLALASPSCSDLQMLKYEVRKTIWRSNEENPRSSKHEQKDNTKKVSFSLTIDTSDEMLATTTLPSLTPTSGSISPASDSDSDDHADAWSTSTTESLLVRRRQTTTGEQQIFYNVIVAVLRNEAAPSDYFIDDRYHYYSGLPDLCALLMINLKSPSLTSLVLGKLADRHLRDAMREERVILDTALANSFLPILQVVDKELYQHLQSLGLTQPTFCRAWIACWFAQHVPVLDVASRLLDVFMVSHPMMPVYVAVSLLTTHRSQVLARDSLSSVSSLLRRLPVAALFESADRAETVEQVIAAAVGYIKQNPPSSLVGQLSQTSPNARFLPSLALFQACPEWSTTPTALSDYALLQRARALRAGVAGDVEPALAVVDWSNYPLATAAVGGIEAMAGSIGTNRSTPVKMASIMVTLGAMVVWMVVSWHVVSEPAVPPTKAEMFTAAWQSAKNEVCEHVAHKFEEVMIMAPIVKKQVVERVAAGVHSVKAAAPKQLASMRASVKLAVEDYVADVADSDFDVDQVLTLVAQQSQQVLMIVADQSQRATSYWQLAVEDYVADVANSDFDVDQVWAVAGQQSQHVVSIVVAQSQQASAFWRLAIDDFVGDLFVEPQPNVHELWARLGQEARGAGRFWKAALIENVLKM